MRIGIDGGTWNNQRGFGRFTRELVRALSPSGPHRYTLFLSPDAEGASVPPHVDIVRVPVRVAPSVAASADGWRSPSDMWRMSRAMSRAPIEAVFFPAVYTYVPILGPMPVVVGIHDVIAERYPDLVFATGRARWFWRLKVAAAVRQATRIVTVSAHSRRGIHKMLGVPFDRIHVVSEAPADVFRRIGDRSVVDDALARLGLSPATPVVAYLGGLSPHKNLLRLVTAFSRIVREGHGDARLLLIGDFERDVFYSSYPALRAIVARECPAHVIFTGRLEDDVVACLLNGVSALVLPSMDEGFGLPAVEAAACGAAVIATRESAMPDVLGDAALYVDPASENDIHGALTRVLNDPNLRRDLGARAAARVADLSWRATADGIDRIFDGIQTRTETITA
jgi:glycosyltransferase involved in cell wall biosynthesis